MPVPVSQGRVKKFTTDGPIPLPRSRRSVAPQADPAKKAGRRARPTAAPSTLPHGAVGVLCGNMAPAISSAAATLLIPTAVDGDARLEDGDAPYPRIPPTAGPTRCCLFPHSVAGGPYAAVSSAISSAAARPTIPTAADSDTRLGDGDAPIRAFPQRHPARATPCKSKGSVLPPCADPCSRTRQVKDISICTLRVRSGMSPTKSALPPKKRRVLFPRQSVSQRRDGCRERQRGAPVPRPALRRSVQNLLPFPALPQNRRGCRPTPSRLPLPSSWAARPPAPFPRPATTSSPAPQWSALFCRATRLSATEIMDKPGRGQNFPRPGGGSSAPCVDFAGAAPYNIGWFIV
ncbi:hypothetical protein HMPREF0262_03254 [Clostridium sp. ATCC 29733]|nr:hypothetical protein HMPREF0262_03254 [Clostridium sp. ATCC 29733]